jgi:hypothetical protein
LSFSLRRRLGDSRAMPIKWTISHAERMVTIDVDGDLTLPQAEEYPIRW